MTTVEVKACKQNFLDKYAPWRQRKSWLLTPWLGRLVTGPDKNCQGALFDKKSSLFTISSYQKPEKRRSFLYGYVLDRELSDLRTAVYVCHAGSNVECQNETKVEMAFRGSVDKTDWTKSDVQIAKGTPKKDPLFLKDQQDYEKVIAKYGTNIHVSGHSLGGARAYEIVRSNVDKNPHLYGTGFNQGNSPFNKEHKEDYKLCKNNPDQPICTHYILHRNDTDFVPWKGNHGGSVIEWKGPSNLTGSRGHCEINGIDLCDPNSIQFQRDVNDPMYNPRGIWGFA